MNKKYKGIITCIIVTIFMVTIFTPSIAATVNDDEKAQSTTISKIGETSSKEEVVYGMLATDGKPQGVYVINILDVVTSGGITDYGVYKDIKNLTTVHDIEYKDQTMTTYADIGKFYYQGNMKDTELPWDIGIKYYLDGKEISAQELAGKSGKLKMELVTNKTAIANESFYENFMLQISITLDTEKCKNIQAEEAMFANAGQDKLITFTVMPNTEGNMHLETDVTDFTMEGISIAAVPFSMDIDLPDTKDIEKDLTTLSDAINTLSKGVNQLKDGASELTTGSKSLQKGSTEYKAGIEGLNEGSPGIINGSDSIMLGIGTMNEALTKIDLNILGGFLTPEEMAQLEPLLSGMNELKMGMQTLSEDYGQFHTGLIAYTGGVSNLAGGYGEIHSGISAIADGADGLAGGTKELSNGVTTLNDKTKNMPNQVSEMMDELMGDFDTSDYVPTSFVSVKNKNVKAVQFILSTQPIEKEKQPSITEPVQKENFWDRLIKLFKSIFKA